MAGKSSHTEAALPAPGDAMSPGAAELPGREGPEPWSFEVVLRREAGGAELIRERVRDDDLAEVRCEAWLEGVLRQGCPDVAMDELVTRLVPIPSKNGPTCAGYAIETIDRDGNGSRCVFSVGSLEQVASRAAQRLVSRGVLRAGDNYHYELVALREPAVPAREAPAATPSAPEELLSTRPEEPSALRPEGEGEEIGATMLAAFDVEARNHLPVVLSVPMAPLLQRAEAVGPVDDETWKVFYTEDALAGAESFARKGARLQPPVPGRPHPEKPA